MEFPVDLKIRSLGLDRAAKELKGLDAAGTAVQSAVTRLNSKIKEQATGNATLATQLRKLKGEYTQLTKEAQATSRATGQGFSKETISRLRGLSTEINRTRDAFRAGKTEAANYRAELDRVAASAARTGKASGPGLASRIGRGAGAGAAAAGAFSGIPGVGAISGGAAAGGLAGGGAGALAGGVAAGVLALGAASVKVGGDIAKWNAELQRSRIALEGVSNGTADFQKSLAGLDSVSKRLNVPISEATQQFTQLRAAMGASGYQANDALKVFTSLAQANKALGGDNEKLQGIVLATSQVFSKGKVAAEELRGQIGERLPGAFADFAKATGRSTAQLDKALNDGEVSLADFIKFAEYVGKKYSKTADEMAKSGEDAGARLKTAWEGFQQAIGPILSYIGSKIQDFATDALNAITPLIAKLQEMMNLGRTGSNNRLYDLRKNDLPDAEKRLAELWKQTNNKMPQKGSYLYEQIEQATQAVIRLREEERKLKGQLTTTVKPPATQKPDNSANADKDKKSKEKALYDYTSKNQAALAEQAIALDSKIHQLSMDQAREEFEYRQGMVERLGRLREKSLTGAKREAAGLTNQLLAASAALDKQLFSANERVLQAQQGLKEAQGNVRVAELSGMDTSVGSGGSASGGAALGSGAYPMTSARGPRWGRMHHGVDYAAPVGTPLSTTVGGQVTGSGNDAGGYGRWVEVKLANGVKAFWAHLSEVVLKTGQQFNAGQIIAKTGNTGRSTGPHLHSGDNSISNAGDAFTRLGGKVLGGGATGKAIAPGGQVDMAGVLGAQGGVQTAQVELDAANASLERLKSNVEKLKALNFDEYILDVTDTFRSQTDVLEKQTQGLQLRNRLEAEGVSPELIEAKVQELDISRQLQSRTDELNMLLQLGVITNEKYAESFAAINNAATGASAALEVNAVAAEGLRKAQEARQQAQSDASGISSTITGGLKDAIKAAISGGDVKAALSNMLSGIGDRLLDIAMRPLEDMLTNALTGLFNPQTIATNANTAATYKNTAALTSLAGLGAGGGFGGLGGLFSGGFGIAGAGFGGGAFGAGFNPLSTGMLFPGGIFASGGSTPVNTPVLVGERGPELFVPGQSGGITSAQNLRSMMHSEGKGGGDGGGTPQINVTTGPVLNFEGEHYVSRADFEAGLARAAKRGASEGERRTLDRLKQSPSTRRGLGL